jgi:hypothetical protein
MENDLTQKQIELIVARQVWLEEEILGDDAEYIYYCNGGQEAFYEKYLWKVLGLEKCLILGHSSLLEIDRTEEMGQ